ncbi:MAG: hypothetical protein KC620_23560, partial [Myxococcales bacterium]|nr:hypothetical protein [Myxococcales bacterium]
MLRAVWGMWVCLVATVAGCLPDLSAECGSAADCPADRPLCIGGVCTFTSPEGDGLVQLDRAPATDAAVDLAVVDPPDVVVEADAAADATICTPTNESCNGVDDDCDGIADEEFGGSPLTTTCYNGPPQTANVGICARGVSTCTAGAFADCIGEVLPAGDEACNGLDDDCDGQVDEGVAPRACGGGATVGIGVCTAGEERCEDGNFSACLDEVLPGVEICDGLDNDCNGTVDDVEGVGEPCAAGQGACAAVGEVVCTPAGPACNAVAGEPADEICDGVDNDCNGRVDDLDGLGAPCAVGVGACAAAGEIICAPGGPTCSVTAGEPGPEVCDGADNDCNGVIDDIAPEPCLVGVGECQAAGDVLCVDGERTCQAEPDAPGAEVCDGLDND